MTGRGKVWRWDSMLRKVVEAGSSEDLRSWTSVNNAPAVHEDTIPPTMSHATDEGLVFTSKSALRAHYRAHGFEDTGGAHLTGKDVASHKPKADIEAIRNDLLESRRKILWGEVPFSEKEKEVCKREEREYQEYKRRQSR